MSATADARSRSELKAPPRDSRSAAEGAGVGARAVAVRPWIDLALARSPDPDEWQEEEGPPEQAGPDEDPQQHEPRDHPEPAPRVPPPRPREGRRVAQRRRQIGLRQLRPPPHRLVQRRTLLEHEQEPHAQRDRDDEREGDEDQ